MVRTLKIAREWVKKKVEYSYISKKILRNQLIGGARGVLHVGAHRAQEHALYHSLGKNVIWVEAIPELAAKLEEKFAGDSRQLVLCALVGDRDKPKVPFFVASNDRSSSSVFRFGRDVGHFSTELSMLSELELPMKRLDSILSIQLAQSHTHWVFDIQGSELLALEGSGGLLRFCNSMEIEVSTIDHYDGGVNFESLDYFLVNAGFTCLSPPKGRFHGDVFYVRVTNGF